MIPPIARTLAVVSLVAVFSCLGSVVIALALVGSVLGIPTFVDPLRPGGHLRYLHRAGPAQRSSFSMNSAWASWLALATILALLLLGGGDDRKRNQPLCRRTYRVSDSVRP